MATIKYNSGKNKGKPAHLEIIANDLINASDQFTAFLN